MPAQFEDLVDDFTPDALIYVAHENETYRLFRHLCAAQERGLDVTTEVYPYTAGSTSLQSAIFDEGFRERLQIDYSDIQWEATGERLTEETFHRYREQGGTVIIHMMKPEWVEMALAAPNVMVASDGMPYAPGAHPRSAGTFSRFLGRYVRDGGTTSLMDGLRKVTLMPARRLEGVSPQMRRKGRVQIGADADLTLFDPNRIIDTATFEPGTSGCPVVRIGVPAHSMCSGSIARP